MVVEAGAEGLLHLAVVVVVVVIVVGGFFFFFFKMWRASRRNYRDFNKTVCPS